MSGPPPDVDVVVVGAGVGGLAVADALSIDRSVLVLERRDRTGGRLHSVVRQGVGLDLGASWFWPGERRVAALVEDLGIATHAQHLDGDAMYQDAAGARRVQGNPIDVPSGRFSTGAASITDALAARLEPTVLRTSTTVHRIRLGSDRVEVAHDDSLTTAADVVLALSPALVAHGIEIEPELPRPLRGLAATTPVWMGAIAKVVARYAAPFWRDEGLAGAAISHSGPMREVHDLSGPDGEPAVLFGFAPLRDGVATPTEDELLGQLVDLFGPAAGAPEELLVADWRADPATSPPGVERITTYATYGHPAYQEPWGAGRLHWASTETSPVAPGHVEGALAAAERAVRAIEGRSGTDRPTEETRHGHADAR
ncbi:MAG: FAD-dependent oxidoreductase [Actinomycetota bacterium]